MQINEAYENAFFDVNRYLILYGSAGSGKSVFAAQKIVSRMLTETGHRFLVIRKVATTLRQSCFELIKQIIIDEGQTPNFTILESSMHITCNLNGNEIIFAGLDDPEKIKSIAAITSVWCEEPTELNEKDFSQLELRVRGETENYKQFILTFNPVDEDSWIKKRFYDKPDKQTTIVHTTFRDNAFLDADYIKHLTERVVANENLYRVYVLGQWGRATTGGEFYKCFRHTKHATMELEYTPDAALHISFDFNVNPYITCAVFQIEMVPAVMNGKIELQPERKISKQIDELTLAHPRNTTRELCREFVRRYQAHKSGLFIYGDPSGKAEDTRAEKGWNDFTIIEKELAHYKPTMRVATKAPPVVMRGNFINTVFESNFSNLEFLISSTCKNTIRDFLYLKEASDGTKLKEKEKDTETGVTFEKYGHLSDAADYFYTEAFRTEFLNYQRGDAKLKFIVGKKIYSEQKSY